RTTDIDLDGTDTTLADLVNMRYTINGDSSPPPSEDMPQAMFNYSGNAGILNVEIDTDSPIGAYNIWFSTPECDIYYVAFTDFLDSGDISGNFYHIGSDSLSVLFLNSSPSSPVFDPGSHNLFTVYYSGPRPTPLIERAVSSDGELFTLQEPTDIITESSDNRLLPTFSLHQNYPNPFNPSTTIRFDLEQRCPWRLEIVNITGRDVASFSGIDGPGSVEVWWNSHDHYKRSTLASGVYFYRLHTPTQCETRKMILLK
ncbi:MAG: T9SS type A sorting domain-containing protein, partial [candidate division Zixibacteria bacterium]|nr:T9SS type A sorting domain-containing protein [candidate division Zixibacteria bacterium]